MQDPNPESRSRHDPVEEFSPGSGDHLLRIENGILVDPPIWEDHRRGKNWLAKIGPGSRVQGKLTRQFFSWGPTAKSYSVGGKLTPGDCVEFGADYYSGTGRKTGKRWYGVVLAVSAGCVVVRKCSTGRSALNAARRLFGGGSTEQV